MVRATVAFGRRTGRWVFTHLLSRAARLLGVWHWLTRREPLRVLPYWMVIQVLLYGLAFVLFDALLTDIPQWVVADWFGADPTAKLRSDNLDALVAITGIPTL